MTGIAELHRLVEEFEQDLPRNTGIALQQGRNRRAMDDEMEEVSGFE